MFAKRRGSNKASSNRDAVLSQREINNRNASSSSSASMGKASIFNFGRPSMHSPNSSDQQQLAPFHATATRSPRQHKQDRDRLKRNRKVIDHHLRKTRGISLQNHGTATFSHQQFVIVLDVPEEQPGMLYIYTMVARLPESSTTTRSSSNDSAGVDVYAECAAADERTHLAVLRLSMELNHSTLTRVRGRRPTHNSTSTRNNTATTITTTNTTTTTAASLGLDGEEIHFTYAIPIQSLGNGCAAGAFGNVLQEFVETAEDLHTRLQDEMAGASSSRRTIRMHRVRTK